MGEISHQSTTVFNSWLMMNSKKQEARLEITTMIRRETQQQAIMVIIKQGDFSLQNVTQITPDWPPKRLNRER